MSCQVKTPGVSANYETEKHQYFPIVSLPTDSVTVDHAVVVKKLTLVMFYERFVLFDINIPFEILRKCTVGGQIKLGHLKFNLCKSDH
jgi:hypothetical protein